MKRILSIIFTFILLFSCKSYEGLSHQKVNTTNPLENRFMLSKSNLEKVVDGEQFIDKIKIDNEIEKNDVITNLTLKELTKNEKGENNIIQLCMFCK